jgi:hypothetical protein
VKGLIRRGGERVMEGEREKEERNGRNEMRET